MRWKQFFLFLGIAAVAAALVVTSFTGGLFQGLEYFLEDLLFTARPVADDIVIVAIDDASLAEVGLDVMFAEPSRLGAADDDALRRALAGIPYPVVLPVEGRNISLQKNRPAAADTILAPLALFAGPAVSRAHVNVIEDRDGVVRRFPAAIAGGTSAFPAFAQEILLQSGLAAGEAAGTPLAESSAPRIVYAQPAGGIRRISFSRVLSGDAAKELDGKIVLIGATAPDLHDEKATPVSSGIPMSGVEIHANIANMLIHGWRLEPMGTPATMIWIIAAAIIAGCIFFFLQAPAAIAVTVALGTVSLVAAVVLFERGITANIIHTQAAWITAGSMFFAYRHFSTEREKRRIKNIFSKYVSADVLREILRDPSAVRLGGEEKEITLLFSDIRGFTSISEKTPPVELVRILNRYFSVMTEEVLAHGGVLDKYIGDAIMAFWGAPVPDPEQADRAVATAKAMIEKLAVLNREFAAAGDPEIAIGIGVYTGPAVVGNVGSHLRFDYTAIGDTVNAASRIEGLTKQYQTPILIGETTRNKLKNPDAWVLVDEVAVKGKQDKIKIYRGKFGVAETKS
ncbi:MAG: adenylate/guanylate cyclase with Chase sensor [Parcubacteria group bacterium Greene0714_36]|nr:MAG: adenylate/guanylate cyclase with Chase sensor [Parcubacteria group bacterium Greene0714_36]